MALADAVGDHGGLVNWFHAGICDEVYLIKDENQQAQAKSFYKSICPDVFPSDAVDRLINRIQSSMRGETTYVVGNHLVSYIAPTAAELEAKKQSQKLMTKDEKKKCARK